MTAFAIDRLVCRKESRNIRICEHLMSIMCCVIGMFVRQSDCWHERYVDLLFSACFSSCVIV